MAVPLVLREFEKKHFRNFVRRCLYVPLWRRPLYGTYLVAQHDTTALLSGLRHSALWRYGDRGGQSLSLQEPAIPQQR